MRKLAVLWAFIIGGLFFDFSANAACSLQSDCSAANEYLTIPGKKGCYECDDEACPNGTVISATIATLEGKTYKDSMFVCHHETMGDLWRQHKVPECTKPKYVKLKNDVNAHRVMINPNTGRAVTNNAGGAIAVVGVEACMGYECDSGYSEKNGKCVKPNPKCDTSSGSRFIGDVVRSKAGCTATQMDTPLNSTEHLVTGAICDATCATNGWNITLRANSCVSGYEPDAAKKRCVETQASKDARARAERDRRENASKQAKCEATGGRWAGGKCTCDVAKNLKKQGDECVCTDTTNYTWDEASKSCKLTNEAALRKACEAAADTGAYFEDGKCKCEDRENTWRGNKCVENPDIKRCKSATGTKWDYEKEECVCKDSNYEYDEDNNECIETDEARKKREADEENARQQAEQEESRGRITTIVGKLNNLKSALDTSVWKNKEGNFNTSRLISDSVAGVVLGTAGGLITSNVIKKNQVKGGFENINCTVRGQVVAGYGDEFQVGIQ